MIRTIVASALAALVYASPASAIGLLMPTDASVAPLAIRNHRVSVAIRERVAETTIEQTFVNHTASTLEATYVFPIPEGASISDFAMYIGGRRVQGELLEAARARQIYEDIVARMRDPGLVEHLGGNLFRARVFPIAPSSEQRIELRFTQALSYEGSVIHYRYPLATGGRAASTLEDFTLSASIVSRTPIRAVYSPTHAIDVQRADDHRVTVGYEGQRVRLDTDFDLYFGVQDRDVGLSLLTHRPAGDEGYFLALIAPRTEVTEREIAAKEVLFVFDTSGSMAGDKIDRAKAALDYMLARLRPSDRFQVVRFSTDVEALFDGGSVAASPENVARARTFGRTFVAAGGTAIDPALSLALRTRVPSGDLPRMVVFLTDGMPTIGETDPARIVNGVRSTAGNARIFVFGVGNDVNTTFLDQVAAVSDGTGDYFRDGAELERRLSSFYDRIAYPLLTDLELTLPGISAFDVYPRDLGHLYRGDQLMVVGRYRRGARASIQLSGRASHERARREFAYDVQFADQEPANDWLPRLWATRKVGFLLDAIRLGGERPELRDEVVSLGQRFGIVTPYTSYLVVEDEAVPEGVAPLVRGPEPAPPPEFRNFQQSVTTYDFEDDLATGELVRPDGEETRIRRPTRRPATDPTSPASVAPTGGSGEQGRAISRRVRDMREAERSAPEEASTPTRFEGGRTFREVGGMWVDTAYRRSMRTFRVRYASAAYFSLLSRRPDLRRALSLGTRVTITLGNGTAIVVDEAESSASSAGDVDQILGGR
jgi:Ca-activated chloride channel family protein